MFRIACLEGSVPFCVNSKGRFTGLEVEAMKVLAGGMGFQPHFLESSNSRYNARTGAWTNGTVKMVEKLYLNYVV